MNRIFLTILLSCITYPIFAAGLVNDTVQDRAKYLVSNMADPDSTKIKGYITHNNSTCFEVNTKNQYGGYIGFKPYIVNAVLDNGRVIYFYEETTRYRSCEAVAAMYVRFKE